VLLIQEHGMYDGTEKVCDAELHACQTVAGLARKNAEAARRVQQQVHYKLQGQGEDNTVHQALLMPPVVNVDLLPN
jgi:hypothetical protein